MPPGRPQRALQWVVDGYTLTFAALLLSGGALGDRLGSRRILVSGLALFVVASAICGLAPTVLALVIARLVQGVGAALAVPASLALLQATYADAAARARAVGVWGGVAGIAAAAGPVIGGVLVAAASWRLVFFINVPIGLAGLVLTIRCVADTPARPRSMDFLGEILAVVTLSALTVALIEAGRFGWTPPR
ncbi:MAG: MFS transporter [Chloroflexota bacterium]